MAELFPKFIIETIPEMGDCLIIGKCAYHKNIATNIENVKSGGWWVLDRKTSTFTFLGESQDFGRASQEAIQQCVLNNVVFLSSAFGEPITKNFTFIYKDQLGESHTLKK